MSKLRDISARIIEAMRFVVSWLVRVIQYLYLTRIPLIGLAALMGMPLLATGAARTLVIGAYDLESWPAALFVAVALCGVAASIFICARIGWEQAGARFAFDLAPFATAIGRSWLALLGLALLLNVVTVLRVSGDGETQRSLVLAGGLTGGFVVAGIAGVGLVWLERTFSSGPVNRFLLWGFGLVGLHQEPGYVQGGGDTGKPLEFAEGHAPALAFNVLIVLAYGILIHLAIPALVAVMMLIALCVLAFAAAAFFFDRYRVPLLVCVTGYCMVMQIWRTSDHYYRIWPRAASEPITPRAVVAKSVREKRPLVVVSSAGGGIQAAAWTTAALSRVGEELALKDKRYDFPGSVRLISGVSGGSVGGLFYALAFDSAAPDRFKTADAAAQSSGLGPAMRGLLRDDLRRGVAPFSIFPAPLIGMGLFDDRASALEQAWVDNARTTAPLADATLSAWSRDALALKRPALVFNATIVETGERLSFSTVPVTGSDVGRVEFSQRYQADIAMTTAARLSATFPFISPTARPAPARDRTSDGFPLPGPGYWGMFPRGGNHLHVVDGGYYENSGIVGAVEWLDDAFSHPESELPTEVLFIELNAFPHAPVLVETKPALSTEPPVDAGQTSRGTIFDLASPMLAIANVRNSGQKAFAKRLLEMFRARWLRRAESETTRVPIAITHVQIYYDLTLPQTPLPPPSPVRKRSSFFIGANPEQQPLSWHLRQCEKDDIANRLSRLPASEEFRVIKEFFRRNMPP